MKRDCEPLPLQDYSHHMAEFDKHYAVVVQKIANTDLASKQVAIRRLMAAQVQLAMTLAAAQLDIDKLGRRIDRETKQANHKPFGMNGMG